MPIPLVSATLVKGAMRRTPDISMAFHVSRTARAQYQFEDALFAPSGRAVIPTVHAARLFVQQINDARDPGLSPERALKAGQLSSMGLIDELLHVVVALYGEHVNTTAIGQALDGLDHAAGRPAVDAALLAFVDEFPPLTVSGRMADAQAYLAGETDGVANRQAVLAELLLVWAANMNPAFAPFLELFDDTRLENTTAYLPIIARLYAFFETQPPFGPDDQNLIDMLRSPAVAVPYSLSGQLEYIRTRWGYLLGEYLDRLLHVLDVVKEEEKPIVFGPGPTQPYEFAGSAVASEPERFSQDLDWMPYVVLLAKNAYVWLDQLSKRYQRPITRLDHIPDEELDTLAGWGFTGLWLIGVWERSRASQQIKQRCGNPDAVASAYSLYAYQVAADLGGEEAYQQLRDRAWQRGIRLASDMVPNHVGIDSQWVIDHPDWFIAVDHSPFPSYRFGDPDLSGDERVGIYLEEHYYTRTDAAVVFKRVDRSTGRVQHLYHGNDGTNMPWNDTAQLNYLKPDVREAVIQAILHVAHLFPIIRFDAAMTLTKQHYQRLWFPEPGHGGAIPSRAEHGLTKAEIDARMPQEFWREVVDRVAQEAPGTLLLAEAFWLLEGYFVRTLGMHRVYNSAFMNMLKNEENEKYRTTIKNVLEFDPGILKRFVNFMNNPDEETAIAQFGKDDKYFGACTMMVTMPGLPMFGHGQVEGFREKYGMEYRRAYWDEQPDGHLIERHEREVFPLVRRRYLFADVEHFLLYDFFTPEGHVDENVFAYSNRSGEERALVVYHNRYATTRGWVRTSVAFKTDQGLVQKSLGDGLSLRAQPESFCIFRDHVTGLEYLRQSRELIDQGLYVELEAFKYQVFLDFREVQENEWRHYAHLTAFLGGRGVPSIQEALRASLLQRVHELFGALFNAGMLQRLLDARVTTPDGTPDPALFAQVEHTMADLLGAVKQVAGGTGDERAIAREVGQKVAVILRLSTPEQPAPATEREEPGATLHDRPVAVTSDPAVWLSLFGWAFTHALGRVVTETAVAQTSRSWLDDWGLGRMMAGAFQEVGLDEAVAWHTVQIVTLLIGHPPWFDGDTLLQARSEDRVGIVSQVDALLVAVQRGDIPPSPSPSPSIG